MAGRALLFLDITCVAACTTLLGHAAALLVAKAPAVSPIADRLASAAWPSTAPPSPEAIARRNVFCSTCPADDTPGQVAVSGRRPSRLPLVLVATHLVTSAPAQVMATIRHSETGAVGAFQEGAGILGARITAVRADGVDLDNGGVAEFLDLLPGAAPAARPAESPSAAVRQSAPRRYEIDRTVLEQALGNVNQLAQSVRLAPESKAGRPAGFRVVDIRAGSLLAGLGLLRGDILHSINGLELTSVEKAMEVYLKLKSAGHLALVVERGGVMTTLEYAVR